MSLNKAGRKLQILTPDYVEPHQLDLLSFVTDQVESLAVKEKSTRGVTPKSHISKVNSYHFHGKVDETKTFLNFCMDKSNHFAVESVKRFIFNDKNDSGIIFLKSASGLGKSHILHAIGNEMTALRKSYYFSSPLMMSAQVDTFNMLKLYDVVLIDDVEEIESNLELQKTFSQLMDYAHAKKIKLIITGSKLPKDLLACEDRVRGKLSASLIVEFSDISSDLAYQIVELKSAKLKLDLPEGVKRLVSNQTNLNVYGMESLLFKFKNISEIKGQKITMDIALDEIKDNKVIYRSNEFQNLLAQVASAFEISVDELNSSVRKKEFALARHVAMYILKEKEKLSVMKIAELFEKDHSSVVYAISRIKKQLDTDLKINMKVLPFLS